MKIKTHELKTLPCYFDAVMDGRKNFEVRLNDRAFQTGDLVKLLKMNDDGTCYDTFKSSTTRRITYLLQGGQYGIKARYCILGLSRDEVQS
ncbi:DUF3850 domain-containing protein [Bartonella sp. LJL80]